MLVQTLPNVPDNVLEFADNAAGTIKGALGVWSGGLRWATLKPTCDVPK